MENTSSTIPSYIIAADTHTLANSPNGDTWFDAVTLGTGAVVGAAATQLWNIAPTVGNWLGGNFQQAKTKEVLQAFDTDMGKYYERHEQGVDALGFALSSIAPGLGGVKLLRAGQTMLRGAMETGTVGANLGAATGLVAPSQPSLLSQAIELALKPNAGFPVWNSATVKAVAAGFGQAALEGAAWETAVAATMYNSPVLDKQSLTDIATNIMWGAATFGAIGGVLGTASTVTKIKAAGRDLDRESAPWNLVRELGTKASTSDRMLAYLEDFHTTPEVPLDRWVGDEAWKTAKMQSLQEAKFKHIDLRVRTLAGELAGGDQQLAEHLYHSYRGMTLDQVESKLFGTEAVVRLSDKTAAEESLSKSLGMPGEATLNKEFQYQKLTGENAGITYAEAPTIHNLADTLKPNTVIDVTANRVVAGNRIYKFSVKTASDSRKLSPYESEARQIWASHINADSLKDVVLGSHDLPLLEKSYLAGNLPTIALESGKWIPQTKEEFLSYLLETKKQTYWEQGVKGKSAEIAAKVANVTEAGVQGKVPSNAIDTDYLFAHQTAAKAWESAPAARLGGKYYDQPSWAKIVKDTTPVVGVDNNVVDGLVAIKTKQVLNEQAADVAIAPILGEDSVRFYRISDTDLNRANRGSVGGGMLSSQNENYGTLGSKVQALGALVLKSIGRKQDNTRAALTPILFKLANNTDAAIEWSVLNARLRQFGDVPYGLDASTGHLRPLALLDYEAAVTAGKDATVPVFATDVPLEIAIRNVDVSELAVAHLSTNGTRITQLGAIRANQGTVWNRDPRRFYPIPPDTKDYPHFATVVDNSISGHGHSKMIYAATFSDLEAMTTKIKSSDPTLQVLTKADAEGWYKSIGQYEFERTLTDVSFDGAFNTRGISTPYLPATKASKIVADTLNWHLQRDSALVREAVAHKNEAAISTLRTLGESYSNIQKSHFTNIGPLEYLESQGKNPYGDYVRSMLGLSTSKEFPFWSPMNEMLDRKVSQVFSALKDSVAGAKSTTELEAINKSLMDSGYKGALYDSMTEIYANHTAPKGALSAFVAKANAILSSCMLGLDPINALNNVIGSTVLRSTELTSLLRNIEDSRPDLAGSLASMKLAVPGTKDSVLSTAKMSAKAMGDFHSEEGKLLRAEFQSRGIISSLTEQAKWVLDNLSLTGRESVQELESKLSKVLAAVMQGAKTGEKLTGNKLAEEFNRFVSGHVAKQITDKAVEAGILGEREAWSYINTFVNRVEGNYIAAQRPGIFQGPVGQAIGLFQTYQFNLMQQLFRHVGEGSVKDAAMMAGLQSTIYGLNGLPAFNAINTHIIGNASGNTAHRDLYDTVIGAVGKNAGEWLMYGAASNALGMISPDLKFNLYTRGDINPRNVTLLPVNPANIPFVQASAKFFGSLYETAGKINAGGDLWGSLLQGIEHAGVNRPLAGLAQVLEASGNPQALSYSTSNKGNIIAANDFLSLANLTRLSGAKPLDEAIVTDRLFNLDVYAAKDSAARNALGEAIKTTVIAGKSPSTEQVEGFAKAYAEKGGKQEHFAQFMMQQYQRANTPQANALASSLKSPFSQSMQILMDGAKLRGGEVR